jgi:nickel-dependent lactate racemase
LAGDRLALDLRGLRVRALAPSAPPGRDAGGLASAALDQPLTGPALVEMARGRGSVTVIVPDATRKASLPEVLPVVIERLHQAGIDDGAITVLIANGTHPVVGPEAISSLVGPLPGSIRVIQHDSRDSGLVNLGDLRENLPLRLHPSAIECEFLITVGTVRHHYFAGFGGGPKMVFPGVGGYEEIQANHSLVLNLSGGHAVRDPGCEPGVLVGNPVAEEIRRAATLRPPDIAICLVEGREGGVAWAGAGPWEIAFESAVERVRMWFEVPLQERFDLMVASSGGDPADATLIQAHKGLDAACRFLKPGGELLLAASLDGGLGSEEMSPFVDDPNPESILARLSERWVQYGHTTLRIVEKTSRHRIHLHSNIAPEISTRLGFEPVANPTVLLDQWRQRHPGAQVGVMAASAVYPRTPLTSIKDRFDLSSHTEPVGLVP